MTLSCPVYNFVTTTRLELIKWTNGFRKIWFKYEFRMNIVNCNRLLQDNDMYILNVNMTNMESFSGHITTRKARVTPKHSRISNHNHNFLKDVIAHPYPRPNCNRGCTVYPKKYAHGFCFAVLCCGYTLTDFPISIRLTSLALWQSNDCPSASKATLMNMDKYFMWIHYERLHNHNKAKHNKTVCIFIGTYCN